MSPLSRNLMTIFVLLPFYTFTATGTASESVGKSLLNFSDESLSKQWVSVNDGVMGGISKGQFRITDDKTLLFSGNLSLENNGGFASIRTRPTDLNLDGYDTIGLRLKGDGRTYYFNLMTSSRSSASSYRTPLETQKDQWQDVHLSLSDFVFTSFGRIIPTVSPLTAGDIRGMGFTLSDKKPGPFQLEISEIRPREKSPDKESSGSTENKDIVDTAIAAGSFGTLVQAVKTAELVDTLKSAGPFTVFAPTDEAFAKLPEGTVEDLLRPESRDKLVQVLSYHVVSGKLLLGARSAETLQGQSVFIQPAGSVKVNGANVITPDVMASNGVIHVVDAVLLPPEEKQTPKDAARQVIELAIRRGVPLFNQGQASACAAIYEVAAAALLKSHSDVLSDQSRSILSESLKQARADTDPSKQAWTLRYALDAVKKSLAED